MQLLNSKVREIRKYGSQYTHSPNVDLSRDKQFRRKLTHNCK